MLYIIRHGKTDWNAEHRLQGRTDIPLNEEGRMMARKAAAEYRNVNFDICFCSPLVRARETAQILLEGRDVPVEYDERLTEMCYGEYEGVAHIFKLPDCPIKNLFLHPELYTVPVKGGESFDELFSRTGEFLREKVDPLIAQGKDVLIVGHGGMNSSIVTQVMHLELKDFWSQGIENCRLMKLL